MEPLGDYLKEIRESKNLSIDKIVKDTHIVKKFIYAIENDEFSAFPGEAYLKGFLRNYGEYLGLNADEIVKRYETIKLAEAPTPIEQLIPKPKPNFKPFLIIGFIFALIIVSVGGYFLVKQMLNNPLILSQINKKNESKNNQGIYQLDENESLLKLKKDDKVEIMINSVTYHIFIEKLDPAVKIIDSNDNEYYLVKDETFKIDFNNDQQNDLEAVLIDWDPKKSAEIKLKKIKEEDNLINITQYKDYLTGNTKVIYKTIMIENIDFEITLNDDTYVKYKIDDQKEVEDLFLKDSKIPINGKNQVIVSLANANNALFNFKEKEKIIPANETDIIDVKIIYWNKINNEYHLLMSSLK